MWSVEQSRMLHDWVVNQRFLNTGRPCVNKQKQSGSWTEMFECKEMIYADAHMRYRQSRSWISFSLRPEEIRSVTESASEWLGAPLEQRASGWVPPAEKLKKC